jgi:hypothetical protein
MRSQIWRFGDQGIQGALGRIASGNRRSDAARRIAVPMDIPKDKE